MSHAAWATGREVMLQYIPPNINPDKENKMETLGKLAANLVTLAIISLILSLPIMWLWNSCLVTAISGIKVIGWLQAWGILILSGMLFKNPPAN
jgi:hypothetical protein